MDEQDQEALARAGKPAPVIEPGHTFATVTDKISSIVLTRRTSNGWYIGFGIGFLLTMMMLYAIGYLFVQRHWHLGRSPFPIGWGFAIVNFVWWIGIGHAGTLISAILLLLRQSWRNSINRFAEAMTLFAVACAGIFPAIHMGRPWLAYWLFPYPNTMGYWPQFRSPLMWDVFAVSTYFTVSLMFWFIGLIPDLATLRDRTDNRMRQDDLRHAGAGLARFGAALASLRNRLSAAGRPGHAAGAFGAHRGQLRLRHRHRARAGIPRSSRRTSSPAPSTPASPWC